MHHPLVRVVPREVPVRSVARTSWSADEDGIGRMDANVRSSYHSLFHFHFHFHSRCSPHFGTSRTKSSFEDGIGRNAFVRRFERFALGEKRRLVVVGSCGVVCFFNVCYVASLV